MDELTVEALFSPGHAPDLHAFLVRTPDETLLFSSDALFHCGKVLATSTPDCCPADLAATLRRFAELPADALFPGHGLWVLKRATSHLRAPLPALERGLLPENLF